MSKHRVNHSSWWCQSPLTINKGNGKKDKKKFAYTNLYHQSDTKHQ